MRTHCLVALMTILFAAAPAWAEVVVIMRREAQSTGKYVRICDVARVDGPSDQAKEVALVVLGPSPYHGETREITRWDIESRLFEMGIDARVSFSGNDMVRVFGDGAPGRMRRQDDELAFQPLYPIPGKREREEERYEQAAARRGDGSEVAGIDIRRPSASIRRPYAPREYDDYDGRTSLTGDAKRRVELAVAEFFSGKYRSSGKKRSDIEVEAKLLSATADIPYSAFDLKVEEAVEGRVPGKATLKVKVKNNESDSYREVLVTTDTDVYGDALVASRSVSRGELLEHRDVSVARIRMQAGKGYLPPNPEAVVGREAKRSFKPGEPILAADAVVGQAVKRGNQVVVKNDGKGWSVQTKAKALGSGAVGDVISVEDLTNKNKYQVRITAPGTVSTVVKHDPHGIVEKKS